MISSKYIFDSLLLLCCSFFSFFSFNIFFLYVFGNYVKGWDLIFFSRDFYANIAHCKDNWLIKILRLRINKLPRYKSSSRISCISIT